MQNLAASSLQHALVDSPAKRMLRDSVLLGAALTGAQTALVLWDESGVWYRDASHLMDDQLADLEFVMSLEAEACDLHPLQKQGLQILEALPLRDHRHRSIGTLWVLSSDPLLLAEAQRRGLMLLAEHIQTIARMDRCGEATRTPEEAPFVPGLVHELSSFVFGISASLDAFEARFGGMNGVARYGANIRKSLGRMNAFILELKDYGHPQPASRIVLEVEPLLWSAIEARRALAAEQRVSLQIQVEGPLPTIRADEAGLRSALVRVLDLALQQQEPGVGLVLRVRPGRHGDQEVVCGLLDVSREEFKAVDPDRLFEPFYFRVRGWGRLTLPGARQIFESHGGTLTAGPAPEGGLSLHFTLPSAEVSAPKHLRA
ncbi:hypothetical protein GETHLI_35680 [Geothrix limicola]|uniref:HAMP domain-containing histidine kinase n=1 Tax=Geothrix limicola TaxID=2927978 RepID=A0ABQ5QMC0_9BACT|nr:HAMP domain-containing sensor histidine kinase [Geothrix limicola]GLH75065.1 hypothetical protein GETHLI_35680 [Geothrix limicola]